MDAKYAVHSICSLIYKCSAHIQPALTVAALFSLFVMKLQCNPMHEFPWITYARLLSHFVGVLCLCCTLLNYLWWIGLEPLSLFKTWLLDRCLMMKIDLIYLLTTFFMFNFFFITFNYILLLYKIAIVFVLFGFSEFHSRWSLVYLTEIIPTSTRSKEKSHSKTSLHCFIFIFIFFCSQLTFSLVFIFNWKTFQIDVVEVQVNALLRLAKSLWKIWAQSVADNRIFALLYCLSAENLTECLHIKAKFFKLFNWCRHSYRFASELWQQLEKF